MSDESNGVVIRQYSLTDIGKDRINGTDSPLRCVALLFALSQIVLYCGTPCLPMVMPLGKGAI